MNFRSRVLFCSLIFSISLPSLPAMAQRGSLIEDLFRTVAEAKIQKERQKQLERAQVQRRPVPPPVLKGPQETPQGVIRAGSRKVQLLAQTLASFNKEIGSLISDLQPYASTHPEIRPILPAVYQLSSQSAALLRQCDGVATFDPIIDRYAALDANWRSLSFQLRSIPNLSKQIKSHVQACDRFISSMENRIGLPPQMDREALHDKMIIAATYMQALLDDFDASGLPSRTVHQWSHDGRLLRQELLRSAGEVESISYEEITTRLSDFVTRWGQYSASISQLGNPHFNQRLDRIAQCGEETFALLWMRPPTTVQDLTSTVANLKKASSKIMDQLTLRTLASLDRSSRNRIDQGTRAMYDEVKHLEDSIGRGAGSRELSEHFVEYDRAWLSVRELTRQTSGVSSGLIAAIDRNCDIMRRALRIESTGIAPMRTEELVGIAASLEGSAEYFKADIQRYEKYLTPASFRRSISQSSDEFHETSKRLHSGLFDQRDLHSLSRDADQLVDAWQRLSRDVADLRNHGLSGRRASNLESASRELAPLVAKVGAALLQ